MTWVPNLLFEKPVWVRRTACITGDHRIYPPGKAPSKTGKC